MNETDGKFPVSGGVELAYREWPAPDPKAGLIILHGFGEHCGRYQALAEDVNHAGISCYTFDMRGHGKSPGKRGYIESFSQYYDDLHEFIRFVKNKHQDVPLFLFGHSFGGLVALRYVQQFNPKEFKGVILSSPLLGLAIKVPKYKRLFLPVMKTVAPKLTLNNEINTQLLSHDPTVAEKYDSDPLVHDQASAPFFYGMLEEMAKSMQRAPEWDSPLLVMYASEDKIVDINAIERVCSAMPSSNLQSVRFDGFYHEIFNEVERSKPINQLIEWIMERVPDKGTHQTTSP